MRVMAQMAMVMNLDKCIGCHTCSVTCKQAWTNRSGVEYVWFNNVETRPGQGYPRTYEDQERWQGGWKLTRRGRLTLTAGGRLKKLATIFSNPLLPNISDYYEPWTYDYENLTTAPSQQHIPVARPKSLITGKDMKVEWSANWDDDLGGGPDPHRERPDPGQGQRDKVKLEFEQTFMFYLPRICEHCLNPSCAASCPSGAIYKRSEDGIVLVDQDRCRGWRMCVTGCPYKKIYFNHRTGKAEKCTFCFPRIEVGIPTVCSETCVGRLRYIGLVLYDADGVLEAASTRTTPTSTPRSARCSSTRTTRRCISAAEQAGIPRDWIDAAQRSPGVGADQPLRGRPAAASGVPHHADGLVHPAAVAGRGRRHGHRSRCRGRRQPVRRDRRAADPDRLSRRAVHRRRPEAGARRARAAGGDARLHARRQPRAATPTGHRRRGWHDRRRSRGHVPAARPGQVRRALRHPARARRAGRTRWRSWPPSAAWTTRAARAWAAPARSASPPAAPHPIAVENFHMLRERQTSDSSSTRPTRPAPGEPAELGRQGRPERPVPAAADAAPTRRAERRGDR